MKPNIHPEYKEINVTCSCGHQFKVNSTRSEDLRVEVCDSCHPFYSGQKKTLETRGRVEQYRLRYETPRAVPKVTKPAEVVKETKKKVSTKAKSGVKKTTKAPVKTKTMVKKTSKTETKSQSTSKK